MSPLPRPVKHVLVVEPKDVQVSRTWARLEVTRRVGKSPRWRFAAVGALGLVVSVVGVLLWPRPPAPSPWTVTTLLARGRQVSGTARPVRALESREPEATDSAPPPPPPDAVGALLESAAEAVRGSDFPRAAALLTEVAQHHHADARAPAAMFALGRIQLDRLHHRAEAVNSFTLALESNPPEELVVPLWQALQEAQRSR